jgi:hypothetical protein
LFGLLDDLAELLYLVLVLFEEGILGILIDSRLILDHFSTRSVSEGGQSLLIIVISWRNGSNHNGFSVTSKRILEETGELAVSVWDMLRLALYQCRYDITQS